jgi:metal transporter CNNM
MNSNVGDIFTTLLLLGFSALFSGLSLGLLSLSPQELKRKMELGSREAALIYPLRERGNQLLVTLLIGNVLVNSMFSIYLGKRTAGLIAVIASTVLITIFGEIIPQAVFSRHALRLGSKVAPLVDKFMLILSPIAYPLSLMLDRTLGAELPPIFSKDELIKIVEEHSRSSDSDVEEDELRIVENALNFGDKLIEEVMTPRSVIEAIDQDEVISPVILDELHKTGFNRFPVYEGSIDKVVGTSILARPRAGKRQDHRQRRPWRAKAYFVNEKEKLDDVLNAFFKTKHHMFVVVNEFSEVVGLITIEDVIEEILGKQIVDEFDQYEDMRVVAKKQAQEAPSNKT